MEIYITCLLQILSFSSRFGRFETKIFHYFYYFSLFPTVFHNWWPPRIFCLSTTKPKQNKPKRLSKLDVMEIIKSKNIKNETDLLSLSFVQST